MPIPVAKATFLLGKYLFFRFCCYKLIVFAIRGDLGLGGGGREGGRYGTTPLISYLKLNKARRKVDVFMKCVILFRHGMYFSWKV